MSLSPTQLNILALDCATKTGWSLLIDGRVTSGVQDFSKKRGESNGMMFLRFSCWLNTLLGVSNMKAIYYEQSHHRGGAATEIGVNLTGRIQEFATKYKIPYCPVHTATLKKFITGGGRANKDDMMAWFENTTGRKPIDDNEADAMAILYYACDDLGIEITEGG